MQQNYLRRLPASRRIDRGPLSAPATESSATSQTISTVMATAKMYSVAVIGPLEQRAPYKADPEPRPVIFTWLRCRERETLSPDWIEAKLSARGCAAVCRTRWKIARTCAVQTTTLRATALRAEVRQRDSQEWSSHLCQQCSFPDSKTIVHHCDISSKHKGTNIFGNGEKDPQSN